MSEVFLCERGQLNDVAKRDLRRAGIVVVEVADPSKCSFIRATETISGDDMLWAAMDAINLTGTDPSIGGAQRKKLAQNLLTVIQAARAKQ